VADDDVVPSQLKPPPNNVNMRLGAEEVSGEVWGSSRNPERFASAVTVWFIATSLAMAGAAWFGGLVMAPLGGILVGFVVFSALMLTRGRTIAFRLTRHQMVLGNVIIALDDIVDVRLNSSDVSIRGGSTMPFHVLVVVDGDGNSHRFTLQGDTANAEWVRDAILWMRDQPRLEGEAPPELDVLQRRQRQAASE
jgi:hypothetical protein